MPSSIRRIDVAGRDVTEYLQLLFRKSGYVFHTSAEKEVVRGIKEKCGYVALDPKREEKDWMQIGGRTEGKVVEYTLPDGNKMKVRRATCTRVSNHAKRWLDRSRALPCARDPLRPRDHRSRISRGPSDRRRRYKPNRHGPSEVTLWQHRALRRRDADERFRR